MGRGSWVRENRTECATNVMVLDMAGLASSQTGFSWHSRYVASDNIEIERNLGVDRTFLIAISKTQKLADLDDAVSAGSWCSTELFDTTQSWLGRVFVVKNRILSKNRFHAISPRILVRVRTAWYQITQYCTRTLLVQHHQDRPTFVNF